VLYFFLSYARGDEDDLVGRFYQDLCVEVRLLAGESKTSTVGFLDRTIQVGEHWSSRLAEALARCGSFVALMTPRYFSSVVCGQEWQVFAERLNHYEAVSRVGPPLLKPLIWLKMPTHRIPAVAESIQYTSGLLGETYERLGIRQLMRLQRHKDDYHEFLFELAEQIVNSVQSHPMPVGRVELDITRSDSAFHPQRVATPLTNPLAIHFVVAAGTRSAMERLREQLSYYGNASLDWAPFHPSLPAPLGDHAHRIAVTYSFESKVAGLDDLTERAAHAKRHNQIIVLLVDAWATRLPDASETLSAYCSGDGGPTTAVMIPASMDDQETRRHWPALSQAWRRVFDQLAFDDQLYRPAIGSHRGFELELPEILTVAANRVYKSGHVYRPPAGSVSTEHPIVDAPFAAAQDEEGE
jgi:FxsC-like protein